jgi:hypothetical protein
MFDIRVRRLLLSRTLGDNGVSRSNRNFSRTTTSSTLNEWRAFFFGGMLKEKRGIVLGRMYTRRDLTVCAGMMMSV